MEPEIPTVNCLFCGKPMELKYVCELHGICRECDESPESLHLV